ncbi:hypothetical protein [Rhodococcus rhodochrous]|uniref:hypothetical protein n=1 Tax=Rhodococcus rhodochrous TaxID=1829 RepID=UPI0007508E6B|nr:hypothetical protein [Rhodococcus rhodochrous]
MRGTISAMLLCQAAAKSAFATFSRLGFVSTQDLEHAVGDTAPGAAAPSLVEFSRSLQFGHVVLARATASDLGGANELSAIQFEKTRHHGNCVPTHQDSVMVETEEAGDRVQERTDVRNRRREGAFELVRFTLLSAVNSSLPVATAVALRSSQSSVKSEPAFFQTVR